MFYVSLRQFALFYMLVVTKIFTILWYQSNDPELTIYIIAADRIVPSSSPCTDSYYFIITAVVDRWHSTPL